MKDVIPIAHGQIKPHVGGISQGFKKITSFQNQISKIYSHLLMHNQTNTISIIICYKFEFIVI